MNRQSVRRNAFTLVELLVVIGIIALLIAILMPALSRARKQALQASCGSNARQVTYGALSYANDWKEQLPTRLGVASEATYYTSGGEPCALSFYARLPIIGFDTLTVWDWHTYRANWYSIDFLGGHAFVMRDYLKNDFDIMVCPDGFYTKAEYVLKWDGRETYPGDSGPITRTGRGVYDGPGFLSYKAGYLWLPHRSLTEPLYAISGRCTPAEFGITQHTDSPGAIAKTASGKPDLQIMVDFNLFGWRYNSIAGCEPADPMTCGVIANHNGSSFKQMDGFYTGCMPRIFPPQIGRQENPEQMPLGQNSSRIDARTTWKAWQDWDYYRWSAHPVMWHSF